MVPGRNGLDLRSALILIGEQGRDKDCLTGVSIFARALPLVWRRNAIFFVT